MNDTFDSPIARQLSELNKRRRKLSDSKAKKPASTRIFTVSNQKGGVGKTTSTVNLAAALGVLGMKVLVIDLDPQGNASTALGVEHGLDIAGTYEALIDSTPLSELIQQCPEIPNLRCLPATIDLAGAEIELVELNDRHLRLRNVLYAHLEETEQAGERYDYVFIDCPPSLGLLTMNAFSAAKEVLIPIQCEYYALEGLSQLLETITRLTTSVNPSLHLSTILLTMYDKRTNLSQEVRDEVRNHFPEQTLNAIIPRSVRISEAPSYGQTVLTYDPNGIGAVAYKEAALEITQQGHSK